MKTGMSSKIIRDGEIHDSTIRIYMYLVSFYNRRIREKTGKLISSPSLRRMSNDLRKTAATCIRQIKILEEMGWIKTKKIANKNTLYYLGNTIDGKVKYLREGRSDGV
jgi:DNA-binding Lrp family transcriptional regulator